MIEFFPGEIEREIKRNREKERASERARERERERERESMPIPSTGEWRCVYKH